MQGSKKHHAVDSRIPKWDEGFLHLVEVPWSKKLNTINKWDEACADVMDVFGLPGNKFVSHPKPDSMEFYFKSKKDAELCKILLSERI
jgi:hypothetical protein